MQPPRSPSQLARRIRWPCHAALHSFFVRSTCLLDATAHLHSSSSRSKTNSLESLKALGARRRRTLEPMTYWRRTPSLRMNAIVSYSTYTRVVMKAQQSSATSPAPQSRPTDRSSPLRPRRSTHRKTRPASRCKRHQTRPLRSCFCRASQLARWQATRRARTLQLCTNTAVRTPIQGSTCCSHRSPRAIGSRVAHSLCSPHARLQCTRMEQMVVSRPLYLVRTVSDIASKWTNKRKMVRTAAAETSSFRTSASATAGMALRTLARKMLKMKRTSLSRPCLWRVKPPNRSAETTHRTKSRVSTALSSLSTRRSFLLCKATRAMLS